MPASTNQLAVWNIALDHLVEHPLSSVSDDNAYARWLTRNEANMRDTFLRQYTWNFSVQYNTLTQDGTDPDFRWSYRYALPTDWLRVLPPTYLGQRGGTPVPYEVVGDYLHCDISTTMYVRTVQRIDDYTDWDPMAVDAFGVALAMRMCMRFPSKATYRDRLLAEFTELVTEARRIDAMEGTPDPLEQHTVIDVRA